MQQSFLITEENLIGSIAGAILQLKRIKDGKNILDDISFLDKLIDFLDKANTEDYHDLLYDKYFIVSENILGSLHQEFKENKISEKIDFKTFKETLLEISQQRDIDKIDDTMGKLRAIAMVLLQIKNQKQTNI